MGNFNYKPITIGEEILVINTDNYRKSEQTPFEAIVIDLPDDGCIWVKSLVTNTIYELYFWQTERK